MSVVTVDRATTLAMTCVAYVVSMFFIADTDSAEQLVQSLLVEHSVVAGGLPCCTSRFPYQSFLRGD